MNEQVPVDLAAVSQALAFLQRLLSPAVQLHIWYKRSCVFVGFGCLLACSFCHVLFASLTLGLFSPFPRFPIEFVRLCFVLYCYACYASQISGLCSPFPFSSFLVCTRLFVVWVCFASQTTGLYSAFPFGSLPRLHVFICYVGVLHLANNGFV